MPDHRARPFPSFLEGAFSASELDASKSTIAVIDRSGDILWVNAAWRRFAQENGGQPDAYDHGSYFDGILPPLREYYRDIFAEALDRGTVFTQEYECSSNDIHRRYQLRALPIDKQALILEHSPVVALPQVEGGDSSEEQLEGYRDADGLVLQCSNCRRVRHTATGSWDWIAALAAQPVPSTSHGICPLCLGFYWVHLTRPK